jgi:hypothetical protein
MYHAADSISIERWLQRHTRGLNQQLHTVFDCALVASILVHSLNKALVPPALLFAFFLAQLIFALCFGLTRGAGGMFTLLL